jgi:hypothetical protein
MVSTDRRRLCGGREGERVPGSSGGPGVQPGTIQAYAFDVVNLARFLTDQGLGLAQVTAAD